MSQENVCKVNTEKAKCNAKQHTSCAFVNTHLTRVDHKEKRGQKNPKNQESTKQLKKMKMLGRKKEDWACPYQL